MSIKTYSQKRSAVRAARKALGDHAVEGVDFHAVQDGDAWTFKAGPTPSSKAATGDVLELPASLRRDQETPKLPVAAKKEHPDAKLTIPKRSPEATKPKGPRSPDGPMEKLFALLLTDGGATYAEMKEATGWENAGFKTIIDKLAKSRQCDLIKGSRDVINAKGKPKTLVTYRLAPIAKAA